MKKILLDRNEIAALPKVELHLHLDCCLSFEAVSNLRPGITPEQFRKDFIAPPKCKDLADFLKVIDSSLELLQTEYSLQLAVDDLFRQLRQDNVIYAEIRFAPHLHLKKGLTGETVIKTVEESVSRCVQKTGIEARIILCTLRHYSRDMGMETVKWVDAFTGSRVVALDLAADEAGFPIDAHIDAFRYGRQHSIPRTAHAGEAKGPESVRETLALLNPSRIGHGVRSIEEPILVDHLKQQGIHLEVCPSSNIQTGVFHSLAHHPVNQLYNSGVSLGINTDTRTITDTSLTDEYERLKQVFGWDKTHFLACNTNALEAAFLPKSHSAPLLRKLRQGYDVELEK